MDSSSPVRGASASPGGTFTRPIMSPFLNVMDVPHADRKPISGSFAVRRRQDSERIVYENGSVQLPPLTEQSEESRLLARSRLWGLWADSVRLQRRLETLESAGQCCVEECYSSGWF